MLVMPQALPIVGFIEHHIERRRGHIQPWRVVCDCMANGASMMSGEGQTNDDIADGYHLDEVVKFQPVTCDNVCHTITIERILQLLG